MLSGPLSLPLVWLSQSRQHCTAVLLQLHCTPQADRTWSITGWKTVGRWYHNQMTNKPLVLKLYGCVRAQLLHASLFVIPWTVAHQAPLSMGLSRQEYWSGLPCPPPGDLSDTGIEPVSFMSPALAGGFFITSTTWEAPVWYIHCLFCFVLFLIFVFLNCESMITHLQETWKIENKVAYSFTMYCNYFSK